MGQYAGAVFSGLFGWLQIVVSDLWAMLSGANQTPWFQWVLANWLPLILLLCIGGLLIDFLVYLLRWQPYRVWRKASGRSRDEDSDEWEADEHQRQWQYADGTTRLEDLRHREKDEQREASQHLQAPVQPARRLPRNSTREQAYHQPVYPPQWQQTTDSSQGGNE